MNTDHTLAAAATQTPIAEPQQDFWEDSDLIGEPIDLPAVLGIFLSRWPFLLLMAVLGFLLAVGLTFVIPARFTSRAVFLPPAQQVTSSDSAISLLFKTPSTAIYTGLLLSDSVLNEVIADNKLLDVFHARDVEEARNQLRTIVQTGTDTAGFVTVTVTTHDARLSRDIVQSFLVALSHLNDRLALSQATQQRQLFQSQLEIAKNDLEASEVALKSAQEASGVVSPDSQIHSELSAIDIAQAEIRAKRVALSALLKSETDEAPDVQRLRSEISTQEGQLAALQSAGSTGRGSGVSAAQAPSISLRFVQLEREVKYNQVIFDVMAKQFESAKLQESSAAPVVQVVDYPEIPLHKSWPTRKLFAVFGTVAGFVLACLWIFIADRRRKASADPLHSFSGRLVQSLQRPRLRP